VRNVPIRRSFGRVFCFFVGQEYWGKALFLHGPKNSTFPETEATASRGFGRVRALMKKEDTEPLVQKRRADCNHSAMMLLFVAVNSIEFSERAFEARSLDRSDKLGST
jgi:hypothetical protein